MIYNASGRKKDVAEQSANTFGKGINQIMQTLKNNLFNSIK
jgi:hypothetical protein